VADAERTTQPSARGRAIGMQTDDDIAIVKRAFAAFAARDLRGLEEAASEKLVVHNAVTGSVVGQERYEGQGALGRYLADVDRVWERLELHPQTFHSTRPGEVLVAGTVLAEHRGNVRSVAAAWSWNLVDGVVVYVRVLPAAEARALIALASGETIQPAVSGSR
jgi:ketosteroid isomerase-like protein